MSVSVSVGYVAGSRYVALMLRWGLHNGLAALAGRGESSRTVHSVSRMSRGVVEMAPVHAALRTNNEFVY